MKKLILWVAALVVLQGGALRGQSLIGTWQGPLQVSQTPGDTLSVVFKISATISGTLYGDMYSIDQGGQTGAPDVTLKGSAVKIAMPSIGATYVGKLSGDGNSITGSLDRGKRGADAQPDPRHGRDRVEDSGTSATTEDDARGCRSSV
jgi:hypothetical protein